MIGRAFDFSTLDKRAAEMKRKQTAKFDRRRRAYRRKGK